MQNKAVVVIDMLVDFVTGDLKLDRAKPVVPKIKRLVENARKYKVPVIYSNDAHLPVDHEVVERWGRHAIKGTKGAQVMPELKPTTNDYVVEKRAYSGFFETGLDSLLRSLNKGEGVRTIILCGLHTHICVRHTAADAFFRGYEIIIAKDGVEAFTDEEQKQGLAYLKDVYHARIMTIDQITKEFG